MRRRAAPRGWHAGLAAAVARPPPRARPGVIARVGRGSKHGSYPPCSRRRQQGQTEVVPAIVGGTNAPPGRRAAARLVLLAWPACLMLRLIAWGCAVPSHACLWVSCLPPKRACCPPRRFGYIGGLFANRDGGGFFCSGTLVAPRIFMTAAHCVLNETTGEQKAAPTFLPKA